MEHEARQQKKALKAHFRALGFFRSQPLRKFRSIKTALLLQQLLTPRRDLE